MTWLMALTILAAVAFGFWLGVRTGLDAMTEVLREMVADGRLSFRAKP